MKPKYVIRLDENGFMGKVPWGISLIEDAYVFDSMKEARASINRVRDRFKMYPHAEIEVYNPNKQNN